MDTSSDNNTLDVQMLLNVLTEGEEQTRQLALSIDASSSDQYCKLLVQQIQSSFQNAITIAKIIESNVSMKQECSVTKRAFNLAGSKIGNLQTENSARVFKKTESIEMRNKQPKWTHRVSVVPGESMEVVNDGFSWRKYGQKDILGANHPRGYYRCAHRHTVGCLATKQVQRSDDNPCIFDIMYRGEHTCKQKTEGVIISEPELQQSQQKISMIGHEFPVHQNQQMLLGFETSLNHEYEGMDIEDQTLSSSSFSFPSTPLAAFLPETSSSVTSLSPTDTETRYFSVSQWSDTPRTD